MPMPTTSPGRDGFRIETLERLVDQAWLAERSWRRRSQHVEPARRNDADPERHMTRIDEVNGHPRHTMTAPSRPFMDSSSASEEPVSERGAQDRLRVLSIKDGQE